MTRKDFELIAKVVANTLATVTEENGVLMLGFQRRFDPDFMALKAAIDAGDADNIVQLGLLGEIVYG